MNSATAHVPSLTELITFKFLMTDWFMNHSPSIQRERERERERERLINVSLATTGFLRSLTGHALTSTIKETADSRRVSKHGAEPRTPWDPLSYK